MGGVSGKTGKPEKSQASACEGEVPPEVEESQRQRHLSGDDRRWR